jgi:two-component system, cell cycle response regulator DivK
MKILIIEDNPANMKLTSDVLSLKGHDIIQAERADIGIDMAHNQHPDLILMDIQLPDIDGVTAMKMLRKDKGMKDLKVIAITAFAMKGDEEKLLSEGFDSYLSKPINYKELQYTVENIWNPPCHF